MARPAELLGLGHGPAQDGHRVRGLTRYDQGVGQADASRDDGRMAGREIDASFGQDPLVPCDRLGPISGGQVGASQLAGDDQRVWVAGRQLVVAADGQLTPVLHGRAGQAGGVEAPPGPQQQRVASVGP